MLNSSNFCHRLLKWQDARPWVWGVILFQGEVMILDCQCWWDDYGIISLKIQLELLTCC